MRNQIKSAFGFFLASGWLIAGHASQADAEPILVEKGWEASDVGNCVAIMSRDRTVPSYAKIVSYQWTGGCGPDGLVSGQGTLITTYQYEVEFDVGVVTTINSREELSVSASQGIFDGHGSSALYSDEDDRRLAASSRRMALATYVGDYPNPSPAFLRQGCQDFFNSDGTFTARTHCMSADGLALRDRLLKSGLLPNVDSGGASQLSALSGASARSSQPDPSRSQKVHNPSQSASECVHLVPLSDSNGVVDLSGRQVLVNECGMKVEVFWCHVESECGKNSGNTWTLQASGPGSSWPIGEGEYRFAACKGPNSGGFDKDSQGQTFTCPEWPDDK